MSISLDKMKTRLALGAVTATAVVYVTLRKVKVLAARDTIVAMAANDIEALHENDVLALGSGGVARLLTGLRITDETVKIFIWNDIDGEILLQLQSDDLEKMDVTRLGDRKRLTDFIGRFVETADTVTAIREKASRLGDLANVELYAGGTKHKGFRLIDLVGYQGSSADEYFDHCKKQDDVGFVCESGEVFDKEAYPLLCTIGGAGQGKTEVCRAILRDAQENAKPNICFVMVTFNQNCQWLVGKFKDSDKRGIVRGLWARIGTAMVIPNWEALQPTTIHDVYEALHAIVRKKCPDSGVATEVHLLIDETMLVEPASERSALLDGIAAAIQTDAADRCRKQKSYALVTSLRAVPIGEGLCQTAGSHRKVSQLLLTPPTVARRKIAGTAWIAALLHLLLSKFEQLSIDKSVIALAKSIAEDASKVESNAYDSPRGSPTAPAPPPIGDVMDCIVEALNGSKSILGEVKKFIGKWAYPVQASVFHAIYDAGTWRTIEEVVNATGNPSYLAAWKSHSKIVPLTSFVPQGYREPVVDPSGHLRDCSRQLMRLAAGWKDVVEGVKWEGCDFVVQESRIDIQLHKGTMWMYRRNPNKVSTCIPFVSLPYLREQSGYDDRWLPIEVVFHKTFQRLSHKLFVTGVSSLARAFEEAVILAIGLRLLALNRNSKDKVVSATLGELLPDAEFDDDSTRSLSLEQRLPTTEDPLEIVPVEPLPKQAPHDKLSEGMRASFALLRPGSDCTLALTQSEKCDSTAIEGSMRFVQRDGVEVIGAYSMKLRQHPQASPSFNAMSDLTDQFRTITTDAPPILAMYVAPEKSMPPLNGGRCHVPRIFIGHKTLQMLLGPFGATYLNSMVSNNYVRGISP